MKRGLLLLTCVLLFTLTVTAQPYRVDWFTSTFLGSLWRNGQTIEMSDSSYVEAALRPLLPSQALEDLRFSQHPRSAEITHRLATSAGLYSRFVHLPSEPIGTDSLLSLLQSMEPHTVDVDAYVRLRLFDHLVGDWSRTPADIGWYPLYLPSGTLWRPIPEPYKNAFARYDGILPWLLVRISDQMTSWSDDPTRSLNDSNPLRMLDRRFLSSTSWDMWNSAVVELRNGLTSEAIDSACFGVTPEERGKLVPALRTRVRVLPVLAQQYYRRITRFVEFYSSGRRDSIFVKILSPRAIEVRRTDDPNDVRLLNSLATKEVRFLMTEGKNSVWIEGPDKLAFKVIMDVGEGASDVYHRGHPLQPWTAGPPSSVDMFATSGTERATDWNDTRGMKTALVPWLDANRDDHLFIGGGPEFTTFAYRAIPYATRTTLLAGIATRTKRFRLQLEYESRALIRGLAVGFVAKYSQLNISNFYGLGNETSASPDLLSRSYFKADQRLFEAAAHVRVLLSDWFSVGLTPKLRMIGTNPRSGSFIDSLISSGYARQLNYMSLQLDAKYDSRDRSAIPTTGMFASARIAWAPRGLQNKNSFASLGIDSRYYCYIGRSGIHVLVRTSGEAVLGDHPWFESAFIGGSRTLRGFERQRFSGDASFSSAVEWRAPLGQLHILWPFDIGGIAFAESGRVFVDGEHSTRWHSSVGFGAWFRPARSPYTIVVSVAISDELTELLASFGLPINL